MDKRLLWLGSSRRDIRTFPATARRMAGFQLLRVQQGLEPNDWKPMGYLLHAFEKRTGRTSTKDLDLARTRYRELLELRRREGHGKG